MTERTSREVVNQAISDFDDIREAIRGHKVEVPYPTKTSAYAGLIASICVGSVTGEIVNDLLVQEADFIKGNAETYFTGICFEPIAGNMEDYDV